MTEPIAERAQVDRTLLVDAAEELEAAVGLRRRLHAHPEIGLDLPVTQAAVLDALDGLGLELSTGAATRSVTAVLDGDRLDRAFAIHLNPTLPSGFVATRPGTMLASADEF